MFFKNLYSHKKILYNGWCGSNLSKSNIKENDMDKSTRKTSFTQWLSPINQTLFKEQVNIHQLDYYTKKLYMGSFMSLMLYAQLHETESMRAVSDAVFSDEL